MPYPSLMLAIVFILNVLGLFFYLRIAQKRSIMDNPNNRSSHHVPTVRGGGLVFPLTFAGLIFWYSPTFYWSALAILLAAVVSFIDDLRGLPVRLRLPAYLLTVSILVLVTHKTWPIWAIVIGIILITGWLNTFNFMDGINGITAAYSMAMLLSFGVLFLLVESTHGTEEELLLTIKLGMIAAILAFSLFNFRKQAYCFAGDVGSISLAMILAWAFLLHWSGPETLYLLLFPAIYAVDSVMTILFRLHRKENIFTAHRSHLYQLLANEKGWDHRLIAALYGGLQFLLNLLVILYLPIQDVWIQLVIVVLMYLLLCFTFLYIHNRIRNKAVLSTSY